MTFLHKLAKRMSIIWRGQHFLTFPLPFFPPSTDSLHHAPYLFAGPLQLVSDNVTFLSLLVLARWALRVQITVLPHGDRRRCCFPAGRAHRLWDRNPTWQFLLRFSSRLVAVDIALNRVRKTTPHSL